MVVVGHDGIPLFADDDLLSWSVGHRPDVAVAFARGLTATGTGVVPYALAALAGIIAGRTPRQRALAVALCLACLGAGQALRYAVMAARRPAAAAPADWATHASGWAFPSGHTTTAALTAGLLIIAVRVRGPRGRTPLALVIGCWGALVGLTRVYLGVHWFTDVVGGWLFALGWLGLCLCAVARWLPDSGFVVTVRRHTERRTEPNGGPCATRSWSSRTITPCVTCCCAACATRTSTPCPPPDGATALRLATDDIAAAVLDVGLPDADGRDVCQAMRANGFLVPGHLPDRPPPAHRPAVRVLRRRRRLPAQAVPPRRTRRPAAGSPQTGRARRPSATAGDLVLDAVRHSVSVPAAPEST